MKELKTYLSPILTIVILAGYIFTYGANQVTKDDLKGIVTQIEELEEKIEQKYVTKEVYTLTQENFDLKIKAMQTKTK